MKLRNSIIAFAVLSGMSYAGGDIGGVTTFENDDYVNAEVQAVEPAETMPIDATSMDTTPMDNIPMAQTVGDQGQVSGGGAISTPSKTPKTPPKKAPKKVVRASSGAGLGAYVGLAVSRMGVRSDDRVNLFDTEEHQDLQLGVTGVVGYNFMDYLGAELRAALSVTGENDGQDNLAEYGIYLKPQYRLLDNKLNIYGLLGYSFINMSDPATSTNANDNPFDGDNSGFSFGAGVDYGITQNISVFTDVVNYLRDFGGSNSTWGANLGVKYHF